jgi:hypothetical protein
MFRTGLKQHGVAVTSPFVGVLRQEIAPRKFARHTSLHSPPLLAIDWWCRNREDGAKNHSCGSALTSFETALLCVLLVPMPEDPQLEKKGLLLEFCRRRKSGQKLCEVDQGRELVGPPQNPKSSQHQTEPAVLHR